MTFNLEIKMKSKTNLTRYALMLCIAFSQLVGQLSLAEKAEGGVAGGGGDAILCNDGKYYSYDYIITLGSAETLNPEYINATSAKQIVLDIAKNLKTKVMYMGPNLEAFVARIGASAYDTNNYSQRVWLTGINPLFDVSDESRLRIPKDCLNEVGEPKIFQAVIRTKSKHGIIQYNYDQNITHALNSNSPMQLSFLYVHEWLRDYTDDPATLVNMTRMLHSKDWTGMDTKAVLMGMIRYGMSPLKIVSPNKIK
jgi:hypothetical protein